MALPAAALEQNDVGEDFRAALTQTQCQPEQLS